VSGKGKTARKKERKVEEITKETQQQQQQQQHPLDGGTIIFKRRKGCIEFPF